MPDVPRSDPRFGRAIRCQKCKKDYAPHCGLTGEELGYSSASIEGKNDMAAVLRFLVDTLVDKPVGWLTLHGDCGTAKTLAIQAIVATLVRSGHTARFVHARKIEQDWFDDMHADRSNGQLYLDVPILAIDELDKMNLKSDWVRQQFQYMLDHRYRQAIDGKQLTLMTLQYAPEKHIPEDIASRMNDGRFCHPWPHGKNKLTIQRWGQTIVPGLLHIVGPDVRPYVKPTQTKEKITP